MARHEKYQSDRRYVRKIAFFGGLSVVSGAVFFYGLAKNGEGAVERYNALIAADAAGGDVESALTELRSYIYSHMNSEIGGENGIQPPIQLNGTYTRLVAAEEQRVESVNGALYTQAQDFCESNGSQGFSGRNRLECINAYVDENGTTAQTIDDSLYKFDFVAPRWSPDIAGFGLVFLGVCVFAALLNLSMYLHTKYLVRMAN